MEQKIKLGDKAKHTITNFSGTVVAITKYLDGYTQVGIQSDKLHNELPLDIQWFHVSNVVKIIKETNNAGFSQGEHE